MKTKPIIIRLEIFLINIIKMEEPINYFTKMDICNKFKINNVSKNI